MERKVCISPNLPLLYQRLSSEPSWSEQVLDQSASNFGSKNSPVNTIGLTLVAAILIIIQSQPIMPTRT